MSNILISVIVPVYKIPEKYLAECINSIKNQDYIFFECLIIDDGSPDNCGLICDKLVTGDSRFYVFHNENKGVSAARNFGIERAKGEYIVFVDGDDRLCINSLSLLLNAIETNAADFAFGNYQINDTNKEVTGNTVVFDSSESVRLVQQSVLTGASIEGCVFNGAPWAKVYKTSVIRDNNCYFDVNLPRSQDNEFNFRFLSFIKKYVYIDEIIYKYTVYSESAMRKYWPNANRNADILLKKINEDIQELDNPYEYQESYYKFCFSKLFDVINTNVFHKRNKIAFIQRVQQLKELCNKETYKISLQNCSNLESKFLSILAYMLRHRKYYIASVMILSRKRIKGID